MKFLKTQKTKRGSKQRNATDKRVVHTPHLLTSEEIKKGRSSAYQYVM